MTPGRGLLDTSVFIAHESGRDLDTDALPDESAVSVVTIGELHAGVLAAKETSVRVRRLRTLELLLEITAIPIDSAVAVEWARLRVQLAERGRRINVNDLWIAATAVAHGIPVVTQDTDFEPLDESDVDVIRV